TFGPNPVELFDLFGVEGEVRPLVQPELFRERWSAGRMEQMHVGMPSQPYPFGSDKVFGSSDQDLRRGDTSGDLLLDGVEGVGGDNGVVVRPEHGVGQETGDEELPIDPVGKSN